MKIAVLGDLLLDHEFECTERTCQEMNRPITISSSPDPSHTQPGGAGNVCAQLEKLGVEASLFSLIGDFPVKERYYCGNKLLHRHDIEVPQYGLTDNEFHKQTFDLQEGLRYKEWDAVICCDYGKGTFRGYMTKGGTQNVDIFVGEGIGFYLPYYSGLVLVDPKLNHIWRSYTMSSRGKNTLIKPNYSEACQITGETDPWEQLRWLLKSFKYAVITHAGECVYYGQRGEGLHRYAKDTVVEANTVVGAGDCFMAFLAVSLARGEDLHQAVEKAFGAGRKYVVQPKPRVLEGDA